MGAFRIEIHEIIEGEKSSSREKEKEMECRGEERGRETMNKEGNERRSGTLNKEFRRNEREGGGYEGQGINKETKEGERSMNLS